MLLARGIMFVNIKLVELTVAECFLDENWLLKAIESKGNEWTVALQLPCTHLAH
jgi:hypothetical protein